MMKPTLVGALVIILLSGFFSWVRRVDELNDVVGGTYISLVTAFVAPFFSLALHLKDALLTDEMEASLVNFAKPYFQPSRDDDAHLELLVDAPDYENEALAWNSLPNVLDTADVIPPSCGADGPCAKENQANARADLFFIGPSTHYSPFRWNANWRDQMTRYMNREAIVPQQAAIFNHVAKVYFPQTRQMTGVGYLSPDSPDAIRASEMAYSDVRDAFRFYLKKYNAGRPFFLAGHSQGSEYLLRLLKEEIAPNPEIKRLLIVAYLVGMPVYKQLLEEMQIPACETPEQTGCVASWQTYVEGASPEHFYFEPVHKPLRFNAAAAAGADKFSSRVCVNPLSWRTDETYVPREHNKGAMHLVQHMQNIRFLLSAWDGSTTLQERQMGRMSVLLPLKPNIAGARCLNGSLLVDSPPSGELESSPIYSFFPVWRFAMFPGSNLHPYDYNLFWANVRDNAAVRVDAYFNKQ